MLCFFYCGQNSSRKLCFKDWFELELLVHLSSPDSSSCVSSLISKKWCFSKNAFLGLCKNTLVTWRNSVS